MKTFPQRQRTMWTRCSLKAPWTDELAEELHKSALICIKDLTSIAHSERVYMYMSFLSLCPVSDIIFDGISNNFKVKCFKFMDLGWSSELYPCLLHIWLDNTTQGQERSE
jgi:hypothetical protein